MKNAVKNILAKTLIADNNSPAVVAIVHVYVIAQYAILALLGLVGFGVYPTLTNFVLMFVGMVAAWFLIIWVSTMVVAKMSKGRLNHRQFLKAYWSLGRIPVATAIVI